jgi:1-acyl-sn-glycerol-3-phosphate acyltransferase
MNDANPMATIPSEHTESELIQSLWATGSYRTPPTGRRVGSSRLVGRWDGWVYLRVAQIIYSGSKAATRDRHTPAVWRKESEDLVHIMEAAGGTLEISGMEHVLAHDGPVVYIGNHMGMLETFLLPVICMAHSNVSFVVKQSLLEYPFFGNLLAATEPIALTRKDPRADLKMVLTRGKELLKAGRSIVIFPQATRAATFSPRQFNTLGVKLAARAEVPIVPLTLKTDFMRVGKLVRDFGSLDRALKIHFRFAPPIVPPYNSREAHQTVIEFIRTTLPGWGGCIDEG